MSVEESCFNVFRKNVRYIVVRRHLLKLYDFTVYVFRGGVESYCDMTSSFGNDMFINLLNCSLVVNVYWDGAVFKTKIQKQVSYPREFGRRTIKSHKFGFKTGPS